MKKNNLNKVIKKGAIVIAASLATMSLFGCNSKVEGNKTYTTYPIDQDEQISNGDKIVTKEDKTNLGNETNVQDNEQAIKDAMAVYNVDSSIAERTIWKKVYHAWPEPPEEQKIYTKKDEDNNNTSYVFPYYYKGKAYWIGTSNNSSTGNMRYIYKKTSDNFRDAGNKDNVMIVGADKTEEIWQLLEILEAGDNIVAGTTKGKVRQTTRLGLEREVSK